MTSSSTPSTRELSTTLVLLAVQVIGGILSLVTLLGATSPDPGHLRISIALAWANLILSIALTWFYLRGSMQRVSDENLARRAIILFDTVSLGALTTVSGGLDDSVFAPQFFAVLVMAQLVRDEILWSFFYAGAFCVALCCSSFYERDWIVIPEGDRRQWLLVYTIAFAVFPTVYAMLDACKPDLNSSDSSSRTKPPGL